MRRRSTRFAPTLRHLARSFLILVVLLEEETGKTHPVPFALLSNTQSKKHRESKAQHIKGRKSKQASNTPGRTTHTCCPPAYSSTFEPDLRAFFKTHIANLQILPLLQSFRFALLQRQQTPEASRACLSSFPSFDSTTNLLLPPQSDLCILHATGQKNIAAVRPRLRRTTHAHTTLLPQSQCITQANTIGRVPALPSHKVGNS